MDLNKRRLIMAIGATVVSGVAIAQSKYDPRKTEHCLYLDIAPEDRPDVTSTGERIHKEIAETITPKKKWFERWFPSWLLGS